MAPLSLTTWLSGTPPAGGEGAAGKTAVVIDILRATSSIVTALGNGASRVLPRTDVEDAFATRERLERGGDEPVLGGERGGFKVSGFDVGNSPLEYGADRVTGKPVVICTSNGTAALERCRDASRLFAASFLNAGATVEAVSRAPESVLLCCSGKEGAASLEDIGCAGLLAKTLLSIYDYETDDATTLALMLWDRYDSDPAKLLEECKHGRYLASLGFESDLEYCSRLDAFALAATPAEDGELVGVAQPQR
jgi:2-phosphosulfolactate phosphatase